MIRGIFIVGAAVLTGCQTLMVSEAPAVIEGDALEDVRVTVGQKAGRADIQFGAPDPTSEPMLVVLPSPLSPLEGRSTATPVLYDIVIRGKACVLKARDGDETIKLPKGSCRPV